MTLRSFVPSLIALLSLSACTADDCGSCGTDSLAVGNDDTQDSTADTACPDSCDSGDSDTQEISWTLVVNSSFLGTSESAEVVVDGAQVGQSGDPITITGKDSFTVSVGDPSQTSGDGIPLHNLGASWTESVWAGGQIIAPPVTVDTTIPVPEAQMNTVQIDPDALTVTVTIPMNLYASGNWTCDNERSTGTGDIDYTGGYLVVLQKIGNEVVTGISLEDSENPDLVFGSFSSLSVATMSYIDNGETDYFCWAGDENDDPR